MYRWRKEKHVIEYINDLAESTQDSRIATVYNTIERIILSPESSEQSKLKAIELYLKNRGKLKEKREIEATVTEKTTDQLAAELDALLEE
ncbi:phBC6A51 family helix-turn-helix protein [Bacillus arachidis]|uniref:phBC6A51 family helix-turn-helix protein n=1 Tax=Bacillus arachidis TaxID=2819290 RepID=UPI00255CAEAE|nr:phBC6A51 family helix-turn-helix protein [Bacillus arachidis]WIY58956.1 phBC6A51 family helix-turn-helix protein [Bacillus arachidis]